MTAFVISSGLASLPSYALPQTATKASGMNAETRRAMPRININTADAKTLDDGLVGVGPAKAEAIIAWRRQKGPFRSIADLTSVKGMGPALIEQNKDRISLR
ncbi:MAG: ComEA family DNA-binding protein [Pseudomonadota bacterium]